MNSLLERRGRILLAVPGLFAFGVYLAQLPSRFSAANFGEDGGDLLAAAMTLGVPHPTGYPAYTLLLRLFLALPLGSSYWKGALASACAASLALILLTYLAAALGNFSLNARIGALISACALAFAPLFWSQAVIVEVQALHALFAALVLAWIVLLERPTRSRQQNVLLIFLAACGGVSLGNHLTILFLFPLILIAQAGAIHRGMRLRWLAWQGLAFLAGSLVLVYLPLAARAFPPVNWGNPQTASGLLWLLSGALYQNMVFGVSSAQLVERLGALAWLLWQNFNVALLVAGLGIYFSRSLPRLLRWGLAWMFVSSCVFYLTYASRDSLVYLVPAWMAVALWIGIGTTGLLRRFSLSNWRGKSLAALVLVACFGRIPLAWDAVNPARDRFTPAYMDQVLQQAPPDALLVTLADYDTFPLWYAHFGERLRPDLRLVVYPLTQYPWYQDTLRNIYPDLAFPPAVASLEWGDALLQLNQHLPICRSNYPDASQKHIQISCGGTILFDGDFSDNGNG